MTALESVGKSGLWGRRRREEEEGFSNLREIKRRLEILQTLDPKGVWVDGKT